MENLYEKLSDVLDTFGDEADYVGDMTHREIKDLIQQAQTLVEMFQNELETVGVEEVLNLDGEPEAEEPWQDLREEFSQRVDEIWEELRRLADCKRDRKGV